MWSLYIVVCVLTLLKVAYGIQDGVNDVGNKKTYKLVYQAKDWTAARDACASHNARLAVPTSKDEFLAVQTVVRGMQYRELENANFRLIAWVGIGSMNEEKLWKTVDGKNLDETGFSVFASETGNQSRAEPQPFCLGVDALNIGYRDWWCDHRLAYICEYN